MVPIVASAEVRKSGERQARRQISATPAPNRAEPRNPGYWIRGASRLLYGRQTHPADAKIIDLARRDTVLVARTVIYITN